MSDAEDVASAYFLAVRDVVNGEDPIGLLGHGAPADEYDPEVADLVEAKAPMTAQRVHEVFQHWFGEANCLHIQAAQRIATEVNRARSEHRSEK